MPRHRIRITGPGTRGTRVSASLLRDLLDALVDSAQQALRLRVEGRSRAHGKPPAWLEKAAAFELVAIEAGSTVLVLEAASVLEAAPERFRQLQLFAPFDPTRSCLEVFGESLGDALAERADSDLYDDGLIATLGRFERVLRYGIDAIDFAGHRPLTIDADGLRVLERLGRAIPEDQPTIVSGKLDELGHSDRFFILILDSGERIRSVLAGDGIDLDGLGQLWGKPVRVEGIAKFRPSGSVLRIDAERIDAAEGDVSLWSRMPRPVLSPIDLRIAARPQGPRSGVSAFFGKWPGDETEEQLLEALDELS